MSALCSGFSGVIENLQIVMAPLACNGDQATPVYRLGMLGIYNGDSQERFKWTQERLR